MLLRPMPVDPVADTSGTRGSSVSLVAVFQSPMRTADKPCGASPNFSMARATNARTASALSGVFSDGFQIAVSSQTSAKAAFQAHTATLLRFTPAFGGDFADLNHYQSA